MSAWYVSISPSACHCESSGAISSTAGNIWVARNTIMTVCRPAKRKRASA